MEAEHYAAILCRTVANVNDWSADADCAEGISWHSHVIDLYMAPQWQEYNGTADIISVQRVVAFFYVQLKVNDDKLLPHKADCGLFHTNILVECTDALPVFHTWKIVAVVIACALICWY